MQARRHHPGLREAPAHEQPPELIWLRLEPGSSPSPLVLPLHSQILPLLKTPQGSQWSVVCGSESTVERAESGPLHFWLDTVLVAFSRGSEHPLHLQPSAHPPVRGSSGSRGTRAGAPGSDPPQASAPRLRATRHLVPAVCGPRTFPCRLLWPLHLYSHPPRVQSSLHSRHLLFFIRSSGLSLQQQLCWRMRCLSGLHAPSPRVPPGLPGVITGDLSVSGALPVTGDWVGQPCGAGEGHGGPEAARGPAVEPPPPGMSSWSQGLCPHAGSRVSAVVSVPHPAERSGL